MKVSQVYEIMNSVTKATIGDQAVVAEDLSNIVDIGNTIQSVAGIDNYVTHKGRIRKLTPRECLRLMGFKDSFKIVVSDTETYKQAGNSIVVNVLIALLKQIDITKYGTNI